MDKLFLVGVNHKVAPAALRERLAFNTEHVLQATSRLHARLAEGSEVALISTCNRTEIVLYACDPSRAELAARHFLAEAGGMAPAALANVLYVHRGCQAARHLMQVAAGLDSLVVGENEIQGQVRTAGELARTAGTSGPWLNAWFRAAVQCGKRVRAETEIGKTKRSVASLVVDLASERLGDLQQHTALLIGAGKISTLAARELVRAGLRCVLVANRTYERACKLASSLGTEHASAVHFDSLNENLSAADIVICSTGAPHIVLHRQAVVQAMGERSGRPLLVADLAIPRDVDPAIAAISNVWLYAIDDLSGLVAERHPLTAEVVREAEAIVEAELSIFMDWCKSRCAAPLIRSLRAKAEAIVQTEIARTLRRLGPVPMEQQAAIERMGQSIIKKLLHEPILCIKDTPEAWDHAEVSELVKELFGLPENIS